MHTNNTINNRLMQDISRQKRKIHTNVTFLSQFEINSGVQCKKHRHYQTFKGEMMEIICKNEEFVTVIKPFGVSSQENGRDGLPELLKKELNTDEIYTVHRLDTVTSGVMVYARTKKAAALLSKGITDGTFEKEYLAVVHGEVIPESGIMEDFLFKDSRKNKSFVVKKERKGVKKASLEYEVQETKNGLSLVKIKLHTGRTHQIRVQFSSRRHPVYGDGKYGASDNIPFIALFSHRISFISPENGERVSFEAPRPHYDFFDL